MKPNKIKSAINKVMEGVDYLNKKTDSTTGYVILSAGIVFFLITSVLSINFAVKSNLNSAIDTAYEAYDTNFIYDGVFIENVNIGGLTKKQALERAEREYAAPRLSKHFTLAAGSYTKDVTYSDLGSYFDFDKTINEAYKIGRSGGKAARIEAGYALSDRPQFLVTAITIDKGQIKAVLKDVEKELEAEGLLPGKLKIDYMADELERSMLLGENDIIYNLAFE